MSDTISPIAVFKEALSLSWARKWTVLGLMLGSYVPIVILGVLVAPNLIGQHVSMAISFAVLMFFVMAGMTLFWITTASHLGVTLQRGEGRVMPDSLPRAMFQVFVRSLLVMLAGFGLMLLASLPITIITVFSGGFDGQTGGLTSAAASLISFVCMVLVGIYLLRLSVSIPAAAVAHTVTFSDAFKMTRGHALRMVGSYLLLFIPVFIAIFLLSAIGSTTAPFGGIGIGGVILFIVVAAIQLFGQLVNHMLLCVWYEKLRLRSEAMDHGPAVVAPVPGYSIQE